MSYQPQHFTAPDGTEMVVLRAEDWERLRAYAEDEEDVREGNAVLARIEAGEGTVPGEVVKLMIVDGLSPLAAWRRHRGLSQAALAKKAGLSQVWVGRIEAGGGYGSRDTRRKLAAALEAPVWALEDEPSEDGARHTVESEPSIQPTQSARAHESVGNRILKLVRSRPGMTELEIARALFGPSAVQQNVNQDCRQLAELKLVERRGGGGPSDPYTYHAR